MLPYIIYVLLLCLLYPRAKNSKLFRFLMFAVATIFVGFRKDVGTDYENYSIYFYAFEDFLEVGYTTIALYLRSNGYDVSYLFFIMSFLTYGVLYIAVELNDDIDKGLSSLLLCILSITSTVNGIRQCVAVSFFMLSYCFIKKRQLFLFVFSFLLGFLFHKSILLLVPIYFFAHKVTKPKFYIAIYLFSFVFTTMSIQEILGPFADLIADNDQKYAGYISMDRYASSYFSAGVFAELLNYIILMYLSLHYGFYKKYPLLFNLFFIMCVVFNLRIASPLFGRIQMYFGWFTLYLLPLVLSRINLKIARPLYIYYLLSLGASTMKYIFFTPISRMAVYHDIFGIF